MRKILFAYDGSSAAQEAAHEAADIARRFGAKIVVLKVGRLMEPVDGLLLPTMEDDFHYWIAESGAELVRSLGATAEARIEWGDPATEILRMAKQERVGLIVMGHHLRSWFRRHIYGSTYSKVVENAHCPVLVVTDMSPIIGVGQYSEDDVDGQDTAGR